MIVDAWLNEIRNVIYGDAITVPSYIALGTGTTAPTAGDTTLESESIRAAISSRGKPAAKRVRLSGVLSADQGNGVSYYENGAFNAITGGTMMNRNTHAAIVKTNAYELRIEIDMELSNI